MPDAGALSATIAQISSTSGTGPYILEKTIADRKKFSEIFDDGDSVTYHVTDTSQFEVVVGIFTAPSTLSRVSVVLSTTGSFIDWPTTGQRVVTPITQGIPLCDVPATEGQVLAWDSINMEWCPRDIDLIDDDTCDMQNIYSGTSI